MRPDRWRQIDDIFQAALDRDPAERAGFLDHACASDPTLRSEVEALIDSHEKAGSFIEAPVFEAAAELVEDSGTESLIGRTIGPYKISAQLGAGGMGVVYLAEDSRFGRKVALKLLPAQFTSDENRLRRFQQEARAALALNHPNVITIFEIGRHDSTHFIATEFIDGHTLRDHLKGNGLGVNEALDISIQVAAALSAAHAAHIIHRDIKPENIMLRRDGYVKVLDFGLAKPSERQSASPESTTAFMRVDTDPGTVLGTVNYMSPEQARGLDVDERSDIFSLGVVLFEMLAGRTPFEGATPNDVIASILSKEPQRITRYANEIPDALEWVVTKALVKDKSGRYQTAAELLADLKRLKQRLDFETLGTAAGAVSTKTTSRTEIADTDPEPGSQTGQVANSPTMSSAEYLITRIIRHKKAAALTSAVAVIIIAVAAWALYSLVGPGNPNTPFEKMRVTRLTTSGNVSQAAISPDGKYVAYATTSAGQQSIWLKHIPTSSDVQIVAPTKAFYHTDLVFSPDGNYVYYVQNASANPVNALYRIPVLGGSPKKVRERIHGGLCFSPDGLQIALIRWKPSSQITDESGGAKELFIVNVDGSGERKLTERKVPLMLDNPAWSPDGRVIACTLTDTNDNAATVLQVRVDDGSEKTISSRKWFNTGHLEWLRDGSGLILSASESLSSPSQIWQLTTADGETRRITNDLNRYDHVRLTADSKTLVAVQGDQLSNIWIAPGGESSHAKQVTSGLGKAGAGSIITIAGLIRGDCGGGISWTPDGQIVYHSMSSGKADIWIMDPSGTNQRQLTADAGFNFYPSVSSDGRYVVFTSDRHGVPAMWRVNIDGTNPVQLTPDSGTYPQCSPDGKWVAYYAGGSGNNAIMRVPIEGGEPEQLPLENGGGARPDYSPDGNQFVCNYVASNAADWFVQMATIPANGGAPIRSFNIFTLDVVREIHWTSDGRALTYIETRDGVSNIWGQPIEGGPPTQLTDFKSDLIFSFDWSRDGTLACARGTQNADVVLISGFR
jgi:serine/threonine protein kinase/Tol biopolymer transport system component